ncbi:MAG: putative DNA-binding domain-containing protein [Bacteriovoracaceae bacterium]|nr:putative DNA-binding domain-containing protein [Bacteriovoracaceae bacterium]
MLEENKKNQDDFLKQIFAEVFQTDFLGRIHAGGKLTPAKVLQVYQNDYIFRLTDTLGERYEACWSVMGDEAFHKISRDYIKQHPSQSYNLSDYGREFPLFLKETTFNSEIPFLQDLAEFEWMFHTLFHAKRTTPLSVADLEVLETGSDIKFFFTPYFFLHSSSYPIYALWKKRKDKDLEKFKGIDFSQKERAFFSKPDEGIIRYQLTDLEFLFIENLMQGMTFFETVDTLKVKDPIFLGDVCRKMIEANILIKLQAV